MKSVIERGRLLVNRLVQYLRRGLVVALMLMALGGMSTAVASSTAATSGSHAAAAQVVAVAQPAPDNPDKDRITEDSLGKIKVWLWIFVGIIVVSAIAAFIVTFRRRHNAQSDETEDDGEVGPQGEQGDRPPAA